MFRRPLRLCVSAAISIPTIVARLDHAVLDAHGEFRGGLVSRWVRDRTGLDVEARAVAHAFDFLADDAAARQLAAVVRADVLDGVVLAAEVEHGDLRAVGVHDLVAAGLDLAYFCYVDPVRHV